MHQREHEQNEREYLKPVCVVYFAFVPYVAGEKALSWQQLGT